MNHPYHALTYITDFSNSIISVLSPLMQEIFHF
nr:MAG TPA: hypothetical protein [Caudoviricetes sp.]